MKRLLLLRHAKSSWDTPASSDFDRPLSKRGQRAADAMAEVIITRNLAPDRILCSPALRTRETLAALQERASDAMDVAFVEALYDPPTATYLPIIAAEGGQAACLMVIGHNPTIHATARELTGSGAPGLVGELASGYPTGALAVIDFETGDWSTDGRQSGYLSAYIKPRDLEAARDQS